MSTQIIVISVAAVVMGVWVAQIPWLLFELRREGSKAHSGSMRDEPGATLVRRFRDHQLDHWAGNAGWMAVLAAAALLFAALSAAKGTWDAAGGFLMMALVLGLFSLIGYRAGGREE